MFLNTKGTNDNEVPAELVHFLRYAENSTAECANEQNDSMVQQIHERVTAVKKSREWERKYMRFEELLQKERRQGIERGVQMGEERMRLLISRMIASGDSDKIVLLSDEAVLAEMYQKYGMLE